MKKATRSEEQGSQSHGQITTGTSTTPDEFLRTAPSKITRALVCLRHFNTLNLFEAEHIGDHCLPSTISALPKARALESVGGAA